MKIVCVCGARPNFMKIAPLMRACAPRPEIECVLVHTGQHYDEAMSQSFFDALHLPRPDVNLEVGSGSHGQQTGLIMQRFEPVVLEHRPDAVLVVGDVNSTLACALVAVKLHVPVLHVEAGLRSGDRGMPEEINRICTDAISELLFVTEAAGVANLEKEGVSPRRIYLVGNVMIDTLLAHQVLAEQSPILDRLGVVPGHYGVLTLHRPSTVDEPQALARVFDVLEEIQRQVPLVFPVHPRTHGQLRRSGLLTRLEAMSQVHVTAPLGYLDFLKLMSYARLVLTDSGGIQEETTVLGVPCLTLRESTERPITIEEGTNQLVGLDPELILDAFRHVQAGTVGGRTPRLWDGHAAERIVEVLVLWHHARCTRPTSAEPVRRLVHADA